MGRITYKETQWIKYQMALRDITQTDIARYAGCAQSIISQVIYGRKQSAKVKKILAESLGYDSFEKLLFGYKKSGGLV